MRANARQAISDCKLCEMDAGHLDVVLEIEREGFSDPWCRRDFEDALNRGNRYCPVYVRGERVVVYAVGFLVANEYHLANLAVHPGLRRRGLGRQFLEAVMERLPGRNVQVVTLEVRMSNLSAIGLYRKLGFRTVAIRRGYYRTPGEDALVMLKALHGRFSAHVNAAGAFFH